MRGLFFASTITCLVLSLPQEVRGDDPKQTAHDEQILKSANIRTDGDSLVTFFKKRTLPAGHQDKVKALIQQLGAESFREREQAAAELIAFGPGVTELLKAAVKDEHLEIARRAENCLHRIMERDHAREVPSAAARLLAVRQPPAAVEVLLSFLPFADNDSVADEVRNALVGLSVRDGKADAVLTAALKDKVALRRAAAAEALARAKIADLLPEIRKLLQDPEPAVRLRVAMTLVYSTEAQAVPVLIDLLPALPLVDAWQAEDILYRMAEGHKPPMVSLGKDDATRKKCRDSWAAWWKDNQAKVDLAKLKEAPRLLGYTLVVHLDQGQVLELNAKKEVRWQIEGLAFPLDAQYLPGDRVLVAEYHASRVSERDLKGNIVWERRIVGPLVAQRLPNGNTFIATDSMLIETDAKGKDVMSVTLPGERVMKAMKLANGEIACLATEARDLVQQAGKARIVRLDTSGKVLHSSEIPLGMRLFGGRVHMLPNGHVLIPHNGENKVVEYGGNGKAVWEVAVDQPIAATRLPNGHTLVTSMLPNTGAVEFDRNGTIVWQYRANTRVTRALRR